MPQFTVSCRHAAEAIPQEAWMRLCPPGHPFLNGDFLRILEAHGAAGLACGWLARHLVAIDDHGAVRGILPLYARFNSHGDFIHDWSWAAAYQQLGRAYYPKLLSGLPHTPATGQRLLVRDDDEDRAAIRRALVDGALAVAAEFGVSSWHVAFPDDDDRRLLHDAGLLTSRNVQFQWLAGECRDFDDYLATFTAEKRRKVRAERRRVGASGLLIEARHGDEVEPSEWPALHALYASTFDKFNNYPVLTPACLADLAQALGRKMVVFTARDSLEPVAVSLCFRSDEVLYGRYWGCSGQYHSLHFELCFYQGIAYCLLDVSGSMDEGRKNVAKRFFMLLYLFLTRNYEHIEVVFIRHHTVASEVDEDEFFSSRESGGTVVSSALVLMADIIRARYPSNLWNIYGAQASDGDNWGEDSPFCRELIEERLLPLCQYFAYIEITDGAPQNLWYEYEKVQLAHPGHFAMQRIGDLADIYPVFRELFKRRA